MEKRVLSEYNPKSVFWYFEIISSIPHGSGNTKRICDFCVSFAKQHGLKYIRDEYDNIIIFKDGTKGYEEAAPLIIQGHLDMVCEKDEGISTDFLKDGLSLETENGLVRARGTTLGADDGIAVAIALALLDSEDIPHPPLEVVFTSDEEIGMIGASHLDTSSLKGKRMMNLDTEDEGFFLASCAGGVTAVCSVPVNIKRIKGYEVYITIDGLTGGHSGGEIHKGRANANRLMGRLLYSLCYDFDYCIDYIRGGQKDNAIPRKCEARLIFSEKTDLINLDKVVNDLLNTYKWEFEDTDEGLDINLKFTLIPGVFEAMDRESTKRTVTTLYTLPGGVQKMCRENPTLVQTSLNMGILDVKDNKVQMSFSVRSSIAAQKVELLTRMECLVKYMGGSIVLSGDYPAWEYKKNSPLRNLMTEVFREQYNREPVVYSVHAGVECGIFADKIDNLDCVSFGPLLNNIHTTKETMDIGSVQRTWRFIKEVLKRMK